MARVCRGTGASLCKDRWCEPRCSSSGRRAAMAEMPLAEHDHMVKAVSPDRADDELSFDIVFCPGARRTIGRSQIPIAPTATLEPRLRSPVEEIRGLIRKINDPNIRCYANPDCSPFRRQHVFPMTSRIDPFLQNKFCSTACRTATGRVFAESTTRESRSHSGAIIVIVI